MTRFLMVWYIHVFDYGDMGRYYQQLTKFINGTKYRELTGYV